MSNGRCKVCDGLNADDPRLRLEWNMDAIIESRSFAEIGDFRLTVEPHDNLYAATLSWLGSGLLDGLVCLTRLEAQISAEGLLKEMHNMTGAAMKGKERKVKGKKQ